MVSLEMLIEEIDLFGQLELLFRVVIACILGYLIGYERKSRDKSAGMRTHAIVCMGAALIMVVSKYGFADVDGFDASRVAAQIVSGVGFLGAGIIFVRNNMVSGLTTAAGIWATAGVGMAIGSGLYFIGVCGGLLLVGLQVILHRFSFLASEPYRGYMKVTTVEYEIVMKELQQQFEHDNIRVLTMKVNKGKGEIKLEFDLLYPFKYDKARLVACWAKDPRVNGIAG